MAYRRLCPGPEPDSALENITLRQACLNAIERFSPSALQPRSMQSRDCRSVPEAAFQDEMYCALSYELHNLPILSEYSHTKDGRVDFFIFDKKWGIEILQCGSMSRIAEHATRFAAGGNYREWNIFADYIILNFCSKPNIQVIEVGGKVFLLFETVSFSVLIFKIRCRDSITNSSSCCRYKRVYRGGIHV